MTTGAGAASLLVLAWAQVSDLTAFYAIWVGIGLTMAAVLYEPAFAVIAGWYRDAAQHNRALLGLTVIAGFASVIYVPLAGWLVQTHGWRHALVVLAALLAVLTVLPNATLPGGRPDQLDRWGPAPPTPSRAALSHHGRTRGDQPRRGRWGAGPADRGPAGASTIDGVAGASP
jgi:MFS family permease